MTRAASSPGPAEPDVSVEVRPVETGDDWKLIQHLRNAVYVQAEHRIGDNDDMANNFDRYNSESRWFIAVAGGEPLGTVKVIRDSEKGLPFELVVGRWQKEPGEVFVEIGHLITLPGSSSQRVVMALLREAFAYASNELRATHVIGDVFLDKTRGDAFYRRVGFEPLHGPYRDERFLDAPLSMIVMLRVADVAPLMRRVKGTRKELFRYLTAGCTDPEIVNAAAS